MSEKNSRIKNLISAHGWLGVIISVVLFLVFWAGAVSLFRIEIQQWAELPHHPVDEQAQNKPLLGIIEDKLKHYPLNTKEHLTIVMPGVQSAYYLFSIDLLPEDNAPEDAPERVAQITVDPKTGETVGKAGRFKLANFIYILHYSLHIRPVGTYIVGFVTLFFLFALFSGVYIHFKKIVSHFFSYRLGKQRTQLLDMHNVIGVISLPFTLMYAMTGLVFNLLIIYQISFVVFLYQGDTQSLVSDAGFSEFVAVEQTGIAQDMSAITNIIEQTQASYGAAKVLRFYNYGDTAAVLNIRGGKQNKFADSYSIYYQISDGSIVSQWGQAPHNMFKKGYDVMDTLHFGNFANMDLRILYFILAIAVAAMIIVGNVLWVNKRAGQKNVSLKVTHFVGNVTIGACSGVVLATAVAFLAERIMPAALENRGRYLISIYCSALVITTFSAYWVRDKKILMAYLLVITAGLLWLTVAADWWLFSAELKQLLGYGVNAIVGVEVGLLLFSACCLWAAKALCVRKP